jgi:N-acetylneuraminate synthase
MAETFGLPVGYSDHTTGLAVAIAAAARGAAVIEKHFTMDRSLPGPDHRASLEPAELADLVRCVREVEMALGSPAKAPSRRESKNMAVIRKSVVAAADIASGEVMVPGNLAVMRPSNGRSPMEYWSLLGVPAARPYKRYEPI